MTGMTKYSEMAIAISKKIIEERKTIKEALTVQDLIEEGVDGELLNEVIRILDKSNNVFDTSTPPVFKDYVQQNIKRCESMLKEKLDDSVFNELRMLQEEPQLSVGIQYDSNNDTLCAADSGLPLNLVQYSSKSKVLLEQDMDNANIEIIMLDDEMKTYDCTAFDHKNLN